MNKPDDERNLLRIAEAIRAACLEAALESYEEASMAFQQEANENLR